ncbi:MAG TPA: DUF1801 domain-containing protein [Saprospiraceae bacterium]|nr:DUF1801 domain-containing protein [Saprospiraceae bacterium]MCB9270850.1 DUF1801 domain-containing protein [Lewinellaceae bacterium]HPG09290.1 DUF1801 domain-containing protein [Saprospiraceae bacterium]HPR00782.1 DUF1801 domain-containing protein [Saprospiraceae bacterium]HQU52253.1 DUF1801 domain-containing protein [Saprospiraceae bacterium]
MEKTNYNTIDEYIGTFAPAMQELLQAIRNTIKKQAPEAKETISYGMPTFKSTENLVHFAAYDHHIGFYPTPSGIQAFQEEICNYKWAKGSVQFPLSEPLPFGLIERMVAYRVKEAKAKFEAKKKVKK